MAQSVHGTRQPTRALRGGRGPVEGSAPGGARTASPGGRKDGAVPEAAGHHGGGEARSPRRGNASGPVDEGPGRGSIPRRRLTSELRRGRLRCGTRVISPFRV